MSRPSQAKAKRRATRKAKGNRKNGSYQGVEVPAAVVERAPVRQAQRALRAQVRQKRMLDRLRELGRREEPAVRRGRVD